MVDKRFPFCFSLVNAVDSFYPFENLINRTAEKTRKAQFKKLSSKNQNDKGAVNMNDFGIL